MMKLLITLFVVVTAFTLSACSSMNGSFDCPNKAGMNCKSLDEINDMVNSGQIQGRSRFLSKDESTASTTEFAAYPSTEIYRAGAPIRYGETVQRIWVAPYEDTEGNYHQDSLMYAIVKRGHWIGSPLKSNKTL